MKNLILFLGLAVSQSANAHEIKYEYCEGYTCKAMTAEQLEPVQTTMNNLSENLKALIDDVDRFVIAKGMSGSAMTQAQFDHTTGIVSGYTLVLNEEILAYAKDLSSLIMFKEKKFLGEAVPEMTALIPSRKYPALYYILLHELGHVAWYKYGVDRVSCTDPEMSARPYLEAAVYLEAYTKANPPKTHADLTCSYTENSFMTFSWVNKWSINAKGKVSYNRLAEFDVASLGKICFYGCENQAAWTTEEVKGLYVDLYDKTPFTSVYSAYLRPEEDFAESFALRALAYKPENVYAIEVGGRKFDLLEKTKSPEFSTKARFIDDLLLKIVNEK